MEYLHRLADCFNPEAAENIMCRTLLSVDWQGKIYNCDFNQALGMALTTAEGAEIFLAELDDSEINGNEIRLFEPCYCCTAGAGSSGSAALRPEIERVTIPMAQSFLTVIIPTLNEAELLPALLQDLAQQQEILLEIIVADGGSTDTTAAIAAAFSARVVRSQKGRGAQMNGAAAAAAGAYLLFLHADSRLEDPQLLHHALRALRTQAAGETSVAGHFLLRFLRTEQRNSMAYRYAEEKSAFNRVNTTNGDQGLLLSREFFHQLGGFDASLPFLEDQRLAEKIRAQGRWITLPGSLQTSARRFEREGLHRRYILMSIMMGLHSIGEVGFLLRAPGLYRVQAETGKLLLSPFFCLCGRMIAAWGVNKSIRIFYRLGRYIRSHSWQSFFFFDVWLRPYLGVGRYPFLNFHDRTFGRWVNCKFGDAVTGLLCFIWIFGILTPFFWLQEHFDSPRVTPAPQFWR